LLSGSKICFLIAIIVIIYIIVRDGLHRLNNFSIIGYLFSIAIFATVLLNGIFNNEIYQKYFYAIYRITSITAYTVSNGFDLNSSAYLRFQTYSYFIKNYNKFLMGDFKWGEKFSQFDKATFNTDLMALNPHSFLIELHCLFGIFAAILFGIWIFKMYIFLRNYSSQSKATSIIIIIFMLTNVTSSTITFWPIFGLIPIFLNSQKYFTGGEVAREN
jgi:hypothetical protein